MSIYTWLWLAVGTAAAVLETVALFNTRHGDTLSEHVWAWLGVGEARAQAMWDGDATVKEPKWTLRIARIVLITGMVWLILHFATGGWV